MKRFTLGLVVVSTLFSSYSWSNDEENNIPLDEQQQIDQMVEERSFPKFKGESTETRVTKNPMDWELYVDMSGEHPLEKWDAQHEQPQLMFYYQPLSAFYIMNLNGSDVRKLPINEEIPRFYNSDGVLRSPTGQYFSQNRSLYDLKTGDKLAIEELSRVYSFSADGISAYVAINNLPYKLNLQSLEKTPMLPESVEIKGITSSPKKRNRGVIVDETNDRFYWIAEQGNYYYYTTYRLSDASIDERRIEGDCKYDDGDEVKNEVDKFVLCGLGKRAGNHISTDPLSYDYNDFQWITKNKVWESGKPSRPLKVVRNKQPEESGWFDKVVYHYSFYNTEREDVIVPNDLSASIFISQSSLEKINSTNLASFFPAIPTRADYEESYQRQFKDYLASLKQAGLSLAEE